MPEGNLAQVQARIAALQNELAAAQDRLERAREYLSQARYAHERGWPCPRCGKPLNGYAEGDHPCLAIERINEVEARRQILMIQTELAELTDVERELREGVVYEQRPIPMILKSL